MSPSVTLTDEHGNPLGQADRMAAHTGSGMLHKAFSVYVFSHGKEELMIHKRSSEKMLWPLFWTNTCCSHPNENEKPLEAGARRLWEEMGFNCPLLEGPQYVYRAEDSDRGVEHEHVTILIGEVDDDIAVNPDPREVAEWKWVKVSELLKDIAENPDVYTPWFPLGLGHILAIK